MRAGHKKVWKKHQKCKMIPLTVELGTGEYLKFVH